MARCLVRVAGRAIPNFTTGNEHCILNRSFARPEIEVVRGQAAA
jgi:hypothetical protein